MAAIEARNLTKSFGDERILKSLNLTVAKGEIFGLIGPSGSGKSTLMRTFTGYLTPSEGEVDVLGKSPPEFTPEDRRRMGFMPQGFVLYGELSVRQNLNFVAGLYGLGFSERRRRVREGGRTLFITTQYVGEAELCDRVGLLVDGVLLAVGTPDELRRRAFDGELIQLVLGGDPGSLGAPLKALEEVGRVTEVLKDEEATEQAASRIRLLVEDADSALPGVMEVLDGAEVLSVGIPRPSFDEVFFRLVKGTKRSE